MCSRSDFYRSTVLALKRDQSKWLDEMRLDRKNLLKELGAAQLEMVFYCNDENIFKFHAVLLRFKEVHANMQKLAIRIATEYPNGDFRMSSNAAWRTSYAESIQKISALAESVVSEEMPPIEDAAARDRTRAWVSSNMRTFLPRRARLTLRALRV